MPNEVEPAALGNAIMGKLYNILTTGDDTVPASEDNFFSWASPGIPMVPEDFEFLHQGLTGVVKKAAIEETSATPPPPAGETPTTDPPPAQLSAAELEKLRAQDTAQLYMQAENFARLVDFVPDVAAADNHQFARLAILNNEGSLSDIYRYTLRMSQVMETPLPDDVKAKIEKFRGLLSTTTKKKDIITDEETEVTEPSAMVKAYFEKMAAYENAALEYNNARINALDASESKAVHYWSINAPILRNRVQAAMSEWVSSGYKNEYEKISAYLDQVSQRDMALLKQQYRDDLEKARLTGLASGSDFFYTSVVPGNFATASGWTEFSFSSTDFERHANSSYNHKSWKTSGSAGFLGIGATASHSSGRGYQRFDSTFDLDTFRLTFKICQASVVRPWMKMPFLLSKSWRFDQSNLEAKGEFISDGGAPPKGLMPAYPSMMIFIKDLKLSMAHADSLTHQMSEYASSSTGGGASVNFMCFNLGASYAQGSSRGSSERDFEYHATSEGIEVPGMQVIGFKCHVMPKSPDPLPEIKNWI
jgi:hypothetical protein